MIVKELFAKLGLEVEEKGFEVAESLINGLKSGLTAAGVGLGAAVLGMMEFARETANAGFEAQKSAERLGITTDAIQELNFAAHASGVEAGTLETALFRMSRAGYAARAGSTAAAEGFHGLLSLHDLKTLKPDEMLMKMAEGFSHIKDQGARANKIFSVFGRGGAPLINMLSKGKEGLEELREEAHKMGLVLGTETIKDSIEFKKNLREAGEEFDALKFKIGGAVLKGLLRFQHALHDIKVGFDEFRRQHAEGIIQTVKLAVIALTSVVVAYAAAHSAAIGTTVAGWAKAALSAVRAATTTALAWAKAAIPFLPLALAIALVLLYLEDLYGFLHGKDSVIGDMVKDIKYLYAEYDNFWQLLRDIAAWMKQSPLGIDLTGPSGTQPKGFMGSGGAGTLGGAAVRYVRGENTPSGMATYIPVPVSTTANVNITVPPGTDAAGVGAAVGKAIEEHHEKTVREAAAGVP